MTAVDDAAVAAPPEARPVSEPHRDRWGRRFGAIGRSWFVRDVLLPFLVTRTLLLSVGVFVLKALPERGVHPKPTGLFLLDMWTRWDGGWYVRIASGGYAPSDGEGTLAFFPLYPMLMRLGAEAFGRSDEAALYVSGLVISNLALLAALTFLVALVRLDFDRDTAARAALYLLVFPTTLFLSAVYTESLFLATAIGAVYCARTGRWWIAGALGAAAALARPHGALIVVPLAYEYFAARGFRLTRSDVNVLSLTLVPLALLAYMGYLAASFGDALAFATAAAAWGRELVPPWETMARHLFARGLGGHAISELGFTALFAVLVVASWWWVRRSYALFASLALVVTLSSGTLLSVPRYGLVLFPIFIVLALAGRSATFDRMYLVLASGGAALYMAFFALWYWAG